MKIKYPDAYKHLRDARARLCFHKTYFGAALWAIKFVEVEDLKDKAGGPLGADKHWRVYYDPKFILECNIKVMMAVLLHELGHLIRGHHDRAKAMGISSLNTMPWNVAGDAEINDDLEKDPEVDMKSLPYSYVTPSRLELPEEKLVEWYYNHLPKIDIQQVDCGSATHGEPRDWEEKANEAGVPKIGKAESRLLQKNVAEAIRQRTKNKSRGTIGAGWERWASEFGTPVVDWRRQLSALVRNRLAQVYGNFDYSYSKPNRRQALYSKIIMPAMVQPVPKVSTVIDTSGSMSEKDLGDCLAEIKGILQAVGIGEVTNYVVDADVKSSKRISSVANIELTGGGGTDMGVGIKQAIDDARGDLDVVIVLTDGYTSWPNQEDLAQTKVIAVLTTEESLTGVPPHIKAVSIDK